MFSGLKPWRENVCLCHANVGKQAARGRWKVAESERGTESSCALPGSGNGARHDGAAVAALRCGHGGACPGRRKPGAGSDRSCESAGRRPGADDGGDRVEQTTGRSWQRQTHSADARRFPGISRPPGPGRYLDIQGTDLPGAHLGLSATGRSRAPGVVMKRRPGGPSRGGTIKGYLWAQPVPAGWVGWEPLPAPDQLRDPLSNT